MNTTLKLFFIPLFTKFNLNASGSRSDFLKFIDTAVSVLDDRLAHTQLNSTSVFAVIYYRN